MAGIGGRDLHVSGHEVAFDPHLGGSGGAGPVRIVVVEGIRIGDFLVHVALRVPGMRLPRPVRGLVVAHQQERARPVALPEPAQRVVGHDVGGVAGDHRGLAHLHHLGVVVASLAGEHGPVVEAGRPVRRSLPQVPLADVRGLVAGGLQQLRKGLQAVVHHGGQRGDAVQVVVGAGQDRGPARRADRVGAEAVVEPHAAGGDAVEVGRAVDAAAVAAHGMRRVVVAHDEQNVGRAAHFALSLVQTVRHASNSDGLTR